MSLDCFLRSKKQKLDPEVMEDGTLELCVQYNRSLLYVLVCIMKVKMLSVLFTCTCTVMILCELYMKEVCVLFRHEFSDALTPKVVLYEWTRYMDPYN